MRRRRAGEGGEGQGSQSNLFSTIIAELTIEMDKVEGRRRESRMQVEV